jgi:ParB family transcriptional regulator, chromosome partitioning protein
VGRNVNLASMAGQLVDDNDPRPQASRPSGVIELPIEKVAPNPLNQRAVGDEDPDELEQLALTIREHGVLQALVVVTAAAFAERYPDTTQTLGDARWVTLIGNRRLIAARFAGQRSIPAVVNDDRAGSMFEVMLVENSHRRDLAPLREAEAMRQVLDREHVSQAELARRIGRTGAYVTHRLKLLSLIDPLRRALEEGSLSLELARDLGGKSQDEQHAAAVAGPPDWSPREKSVNAVKTTASRRRSLPAGDPAAAARSIREVYSGDELAELIALLSSEPSTS